MRAITYSAFGAAADVLALTELPRPNPAAGEVLVQIHRSGVNPSDVKSRAGGRPGVPKPAYPVIIPHSDGAGMISAVGAGIDPARIGQRVWLWNAQWQRPFGTAADYIALPAEQAVPLADDIGFDAGATLGIPALTAAHAVFGGGDVAGKTLLVSGAGGSVGHMAVQLAKSGGAHVIATASTGTSTTHARAAGADHVLDYRAPDLAAQILALTGGQMIDRAVEGEFGANIDSLAQVLAPNATIAAYGSALDMAPALPFGPLLFKAITIDILLVYILTPAQRAAAITRVTTALANATLTPRIHASYPLVNCAAAHLAVEAGNRHGAILLDMTAG